MLQEFREIYPENNKVTRRPHDTNLRRLNSPQQSHRPIACQSNTLAEKRC